MSRYIILGEEEKKNKEIVISEKECRYKVNNMCFNNCSLKDLGKKCHKREECEYFEREFKSRKKLIDFNRRGKHG